MAVYISSLVHSRLPAALSEKRTGTFWLIDINATKKLPMELLKPLPHNEIKGFISGHAHTLTTSK